MGLFSGRQVAHPTDCFIRNVALISLAVLGGLLLYDRVNETQKQPGNEWQSFIIIIKFKKRLKLGSKTYTNIFIHM